MMSPLGFLGGLQATASAVFDPFRGVTVRFLILSEGTEKCKRKLVHMHVKIFLSG